MHPCYLFTGTPVVSVMTMSSNTTVQIVGLVPVLGGVYANDTSLVITSSRDVWHYTIHVCRPVWIKNQNSGVDVTSYTYSNVSDVRNKYAFHWVAGVHVYCILNGRRCYCTRLSRVNGEKRTDSISHTLTLLPSLHVAPNISCPDIIRTETHGRVTWRTDGDDILTQDQQQLLEFASNQLYKGRFGPAPKITPQPLSDDIHLGRIDHTTTSSLLSTRSYAVAKVANMLFVCRKKCVPSNQDGKHEHDEAIYFPYRGGPYDALQRLKVMLQSLRNKKDQTANNSTVVSSPLTVCDICGDEAIVLHINESESGIVFGQPIALVPVRGSMCTHQPPAPLHLFSISLENAAWLEREILCGQEDHNVEALSQRIAKALQLCV